MSQIIGTPVFKLVHVWTTLGHTFQPKILIHIHPYVFAITDHTWPPLNKKNDPWPLIMYICEPNFPKKYIYVHLIIFVLNIVFYGGLDIDK